MVPGCGLPFVTLSEGKPQLQFCNIFHVNFVGAPNSVPKPYFCIIFWDMMQIHIRQIEFGTPEYDEAVWLRYEVLRRPLGLEFTPEQLAEEYDQIHLAAYEPAGRLLAYLNLTPIDADIVKMRQVAVASALQGRGVGKALVAESERLAADLHFKKMTLHARQVAVPFYERLGYSIVGEPFEEVSIPHFKMEKGLRRN